MKRLRRLVESSAAVFLLIETSLILADFLVAAHL
jgi:hypothetical protein